MNRQLHQFAAAHLRTEVERAVYRALVLEPDRHWTTEALAAAAGVDHGRADVVRRRLVDAGAVDETSAAERRYRWSPSMRYMFSAGRAAAVIDPFCGMPVRNDRHRLIQDGTELNFCSLRCQTLFKRERRVRGIEQREQCN